MSGWMDILRDDVIEHFILNSSYFYQVYIFYFFRVEVIKYVSFD
jgi:hypothetical protein